MRVGVWGSREPISLLNQLLVLPIVNDDFNNAMTILINYSSTMVDDSYHPVPIRMALGCDCCG